MMNPALPFKWDKINNFRSCDGRMASEEFDRYAVAAGIRGITGSDGVETRRWDERIEEFVTNEVNDSEFDKLFMRRNYGQRRMWMLFPPNEDADATQALIFDDESGSFSKYVIPMNVLGYAGSAQDADLQDFGDQTLQDFGNKTLQDFSWDLTAEIFVGGDPIVTGKHSSE